MVVHKVHVLEGHVLGKAVTVLASGVLSQLTVVSCPLDVVSFVDVHFLVKDVADDHEVNGAVAALVLHLVESVDTHEVTLGVLLQMGSIVLNNCS